MADDRLEGVELQLTTPAAIVTVTSLPITQNGLSGATMKNMAEEAGISPAWSPTTTRT